MFTVEKILALFSIVAYASVMVPPDVFWPAGFLGLCIPFLLLAHSGFLVVWLRSKTKKRALLSFAVLLIGYPFLQATVSWNWAGQDSSPISVLSYNARVFNLYENDRKKEYTSSKEAIAWVMADDSDIKCLQEFYNDRRSSLFNTTRQLGQKSGYHSFVQPVVVNRIGAQFGLAIFSKFPIVAKGVVDMRERSTNSAIFADVVVGEDTLRIYNAHLQSLNFEASDIDVLENFKGKSENIARTLKHGFIARARQVKLLAAHIGESPYPTLLCCDLNETPYSYAYFLLSKLLENTFETCGRGFGFSYNGPLFFIRIDHQFHSPELHPQRFQTLRQVGFSDHFPVKATYRLVP